MNTFIVDTHALVWYLDKDKKLSKTAEKALDSSDVTLVIPTVVLAEVKHLFSKRRISISFENVMQAIENDHRCIIYPFDLSCVEHLDERLDLHDGIIVDSFNSFMFNKETLLDAIMKAEVYYCLEKPIITEIKFDEPKNKE